MRLIVSAAASGLASLTSCATERVFERVSMQVSILQWAQIEQLMTEEFVNASGQNDLASRKNCDTGAGQKHAKTIPLMLSIECISIDIESLVYSVVSEVVAQARPSFQRYEQINQQHLFMMRLCDPLVEEPGNCVVERELYKKSCLLQNGSTDELSAP